MFFIAAVISKIKFGFFSKAFPITTTSAPACAVITACSEEFISGFIAADAEEGSVLFAGFQPILGGVYPMGAIGLHYTAHLRHYPGYVFAGSFK